ncbi:MAG: UDP-N-acetylglucosamine 2-epimerase (hydrolyzing) [Candidatus Lindowbacteria bacterium]|nr:UDP-N-acetylglucosamine 2-epimerase (hydrolyzing) [Candidatus Lindowbacteria bacterium]
MKKRTITVFTGTRAEYGLIRPLLCKIESSKKFELDLVVTGTHLEKEFGNTIKEIQKDGFKKLYKIPLKLKSDDAAGLTDAMAELTLKLGRHFKKMKPDFFFVLGDRYEALTATTTAAFHQIPIGHINGGELTEGAMDDSFRHAITKLSYLHFSSAEVYQKRIISMGEEPSRVFNVGHLCADSIREYSLYSKNEIKKKLGIPMNNSIYLITFHSETNRSNKLKTDLSHLLNQLKKSSETLIFTMANADPGGNYINEQIRKFVSKKTDSRFLFSSLGIHMYLSLMKVSAAVIGNSSSGISEAPLLGVPTINIGDRQKGRLRAVSIIDIDCTELAIAKALKHIQTSKFQKKQSRIISPYGSGNASKKIVSILEKNDLSKLSPKVFHEKRAR